MRRLFVCAYLANLAVDLGSLAALPDRVAIHFGPRGMPDNWASKETNAALMVGLHTLLFALLSLTPRLIAVVPVGWVNLPHKEYWLRKDRRPDTLARIAAHFWTLGAALFGFMLWVGVLVVLANRSQPVCLDLPWFLGGLGAFLAYTAWWCVRFYRAFRLPPGEDATVP